MIPDEEGRVIEIDEWKRMIEKYLPTFHCRKFTKCSLLYGIYIGSLEKQKHFYVQQSWVHSFDCNVHDFHMKMEDSILIAGTLVHSLSYTGQ